MAQQHFIIAWWASYKYYLSATDNLQKNTFWKKINNGGISEESYYEYQKIIQEATLDKYTELPLYVENLTKYYRKLIFLFLHYLENQI